MRVPLFPDGGLLQGGNRIGRGGGAARRGPYSVPKSERLGFVSAARACLFLGFNLATRHLTGGWRVTFSNSLVALSINS
jgi:hypothetical protein